MASPIPLQMQTLVIGGTAFIGRHTVEELLRRGHEVTLFHRGRSPSPFGDRVSEVFGDRLQYEAVREGLSGRRFDAVVDIAYVWGKGTGPREVSSVLDAIGEGLRRYVFLSTCAVYGEAPLPLAEGSPRNASLGRYSADKIATEDHLLAEQSAGRLTASIVRPPFVYGPYNNVPREEWFWDRILARRPVIVPDRGETLTHLVAVRDVAWALAECTENPAARGEVFNIAEDAPVRHGAYIDRLAEVAELPVEKVFIPRSRIHSLGGTAFSPPLYFGVGFDVEVDLSVDISKARRVLGFRPTNPLAGLQEAFAWYMKEDRWRTPKFSFDREVLGR